MWCLLYNYVCALWYTFSNVNEEIRNSLNIENQEVELLPIPKDEDRADFIEKHLKE